MGCGQKAVAEDEDDWDILCREARISVLWDCYSNKARHASMGFRKMNLKGPRLLKYVELMMMVDDLLADQRVEEDALKVLSRLKKKYE